LERHALQCYIFIHSFSFCSQLEHRAPFGVSVTIHTIRHTVGLLWTSDQPVAETLYLHRTTQHINTTDKHPCSEQDSNPRPQQPSGSRPTTYTARPLGSAKVLHIQGVKNVTKPMAYRECVFPGRLISKRLWPPRSPDLSPQTSFYGGISRILCIQIIHTHTTRA
jgi:hypothetical protein